MAVQWMNDSPPPATSGRNAGLHVGIIAELKEQPGRWAIVRSGLPSSTLSASKTRLEQLGANVESRADGEGAYNLWARWPLRDDTAAG